MRAWSSSQTGVSGIGLRDWWYTPLVTVDGHLRGGVRPSPGRWCVLTSANDPAAALRGALPAECRRVGGRPWG
jgi:hypothetical protein